MTSEYRALVAKVEAFTDATYARRHGDFACSAGCAACCHTWLSVSAVEADALRAGLAALTPEARADVRKRGQRELAREQNDDSAPRCAMLDDDDRCSVYGARPLVCRTQGHALRYPFGLIPTDAIARRSNNGDVTWCPLNYDRSEPNAEDVLDAERVDQILAVVAARHALAHAIDHQARFKLSALAAETDVLHDDSARHGHLEPFSSHRDTDE